MDLQNEASGTSKANDFTPYDINRRCPNKHCNNEWIEHDIEKPVITICGGNVSVCEVCKEQGYSVYNCCGDGMYYLSKNDIFIEKYDHNTAYNITHSPEKIEE